MNRIGLLNSAGLLLAFASSALWLALSRDPASPSAPPVADAAREAPAARSVVTDARGKRVAVRDYRRIVSASIIADELLWSLCAPDRIVAFTTQALYHPLFGYRYAGKPAVEGLRQVEAVLALKPDLVVMSHFADARHIQRLEDAGVTVFDLGEMFGAESLLRNIRDVADVVGNTAGGARLARDFERRLNAVSPQTPEAERPRAIYLSVYGTKLFGGTRGSSYHDVLVAAGLRDVAATRLRGWPELDAETVLSLGPELVVTKAGMEAAVCAYPGLSRVPACQHAGHVVGVSDILIDSPGLAMVDAAEELRARVFGPGGPEATAAR